MSSAPHQFKDLQNPTRIPRQKKDFDKLDSVVNDFAAKHNVLSSSSTETTAPAANETAPKTSGPAPTEVVAPEAPPVAPSQQTAKIHTLRKGKREKTTQRLAGDIPVYVRKAFFKKAHDEGLTVRCAIVRAIAAYGIHVEPEDLVEDLRSAR